MAEVKAAVHGLHFAVELGFHHVILESDSKTVVHKLKSSGEDSSEIDLLFQISRILLIDLSNAILASLLRKLTKLLMPLQLWTKFRVSISVGLKKLLLEALSFIETDRRNLGPH
ncbi:hypothetical protein V6N13_052168 [Hibiscus sabdariffa]|uniref:RNase H type-1 domain-containing protein n=1 Tax=Hibiscus sabdariffa TaxID=183260 RepID=A0ABR2BI25_9ROSI